jgi:Ti-type conjugative transfer relaxase TraA
MSLMAIYHFSAKVISRAAGSSVLAAAAYRSASRLHDQRLDRHHDFSKKAGVIHSEVILPEDAPEHLSDRERLWNQVEAAEKRIDAQLAREIEFALPRELSPEMGIELAREFVQREFVGLGMIADLNVHRDVGADGEPMPHAHVMLTMREVDENGFAAKVRDWNRTALLQHWREAWADHVNQRLAELDIDARVDHRSLQAQGIDLEPQNKIGPAASRMAAQGLQLERIDEHREIARANGEKLLANPEMALDAITHIQSTFTRRDAAMFVHRHSEGKEQFDAIMAAIRASREVVYVGKEGRGEERFTSRAMLETEQRLERATVHLDARRHDAVAEQHRRAAIARAEARGLRLTIEQKGALEHVTGARGIGTVIGYAGTGKSAMLGVAREALELGGRRVQGATLSGIAAENLEAGSGIQSRTIASLEHQWSQGRELLGTDDVLVIDEAGMIGTRQMERVIGEAEKRGAKVVLVGDPEQLQAIEAGAAFRSIAERHGWAEITEIRRQQEEWQRSATRQLATGRTDEALAAYEDHGHVSAAETRDQARADLVDSWERDRAAAPEATRIILTHTNDEVQALNALARERLSGAGELGEEVTLQTDRGARSFAAGDRIMFLRNERSLGVKNGTLGRVESVSATRMAVMLDDGSSVAFDIKDYAHLDHGYAATVHKAQGVTVDRVHVLATPGLDRHAAYVALSRHRETVELHYGRDDFEDRGKLVRALSRERGKDMASDYGHETSLPGAMTSISGPESRRPSPGRHSERERSNPLGTAVQRTARILAQMMEQQRRGGGELPHHRAELDAAAKALNTLRHEASRDLRAAFIRDMQLLPDAANGKTGPAVKAMEWERRYRTDPQLRADQFVKTWRALGDRHEMFERRGNISGADGVRGQMTAFAKTLERDPQVESLLRTRDRELGVPPYLDRPLSQALPNWIGWGRGRGIER